MTSIHGEYLGEITVDLPTHPDYRSHGPKEWALLWIRMYGGIDGEHHKTWVLDQTVRILNGTPVIAKEARWADGTSELRFQLGEATPAYADWVEEQLGEKSPDGACEYGWDSGITL